MHVNGNPGSPALGNAAPPSQQQQQQQQPRPTTRSTTSSTTASPATSPAPLPEGKQARKVRLIALQVMCPDSMQHNLFVCEKRSL